MPRKHPRVRVEKNLYRAGDVYYACATPPGGRQAVWQPLGVVGVMEARRLRDAFVASVRRSTPRITPSRLTFGQVAAEWLEVQAERVASHELVPRTHEAYEGGLRRHVVPSFGHRPIRSITPDDLVRWNRQMRKRGLALATVRVAWTPLRLALDHAVRHHALEANPADKLLSHEIPKPGPSRQRFLTRDEIGRLLGAAADPYRPALAIGVLAGLRVGEILGLTWTDIDLTGGNIKVRAQLGRDGGSRDPKTSAGRRNVILILELGRDLRRFRRASAHAGPDDLVFSTSNGRSIGDRNMAHRGLEKACRRAGLDGVTFHTLRHTFASILVAHGHDPVFVSRQLGHANPSITLRVYAHLFDAARHADTARKRLEEEYRGVLLRRDEPEGQLGLTL